MFLDNLKTIALQVFILYLMAGVGFVTDKVGLFKQSDGKRLIDLIFNVVLPIAIINTFIKMEYTPSHVKGLVVAFVCAIATHIFGALISLFTFKKQNVNLRGIYHYATVFSNASFLALPLAQSVIGEEGIFIARYTWRYLIYLHLLTVSMKYRAEKQNRLEKLIFNPGSISVIIGLPLFFLKFKAPYVIEYPLQMISNCNSPLAMIVFGTFLANSNFKNLIKKKELYFVSFLRLVFIPVCMLLLFKMFNVNGDLLVAMTISAAAPTATNTAMYAAKYDNDAALGSELAAQSSVLSVISMPVIVALASVI